MTTGFRLRNASVSLEDILPDRDTNTEIPQYLSLSDIIAKKKNLAMFKNILTDCSYEYDLVLPVDIEKAVRKNVTGLRVLMTNTSNLKYSRSKGNTFKDEKKTFSFKINFFDDLPDSIDVNETDTDSFLEKVKKVRRTIRSTNDPLTVNSIVKNSVEDSRSLPISMAGSTRGTIRRIMNSSLVDPIDTLTGCIIKTTRDVVEQPTGQGIDPVFLPFLKVTDGNNILGESLRDLKDNLLEEAESINTPSDGSNESLLAALIENESPTIETLGLKSVEYIDYTTTILPVKRKVKIYGKTISPNFEISLMIQPIMKDQNRSNTAVESMRFDMSDEFKHFLEPVCPPELRIISNGRGSVVVELDKKDPTIQEGVLTIAHHNPVYPNRRLPPKSKKVKFGNAQKAIQSFDGLHNVDPIVTTITFHVLHPLTDDAALSVSKKLKAFKSNLSAQMPDALDVDDDIRIFAYSLPTGVSLRIEGTSDNVKNVSVIREDMSVPLSNRISRRVLGFLGQNENQQGDFVFEDRDVIKGHLYRYYLNYQKESPVKIFEKYPKWEEQQLFLGQHGSGVHTKDSFDSAIIRYKKSNFVQAVDLGTPRVGFDRTGVGRVEITASYSQETKNSGLGGLSNILASQTQDSKIAEIQTLSTKIPMAVVERIDRVTGNEKEIGIIILDRKNSLFVDDLFFNDIGNVQSATGKFTYKFKICMPTIGSLLGSNIPSSLVNRPGNSIDALKFTAEQFTADGRLPSSSFLENPGYLEIIKTADTGGRTYADFDLSEPNVSRQEKIVTLKGVKVRNGHRLSWTVDSESERSIEGFLVFKEQGSSKDLVGVVKYTDASLGYSFSDVSRFSRIIPTPIPCIYSVMPITTSGVYLQESNSYNTSRGTRSINRASSIENLARTMSRFPVTKINRVTRE
jgi:hypothetical protein